MAEPKKLAKKYLVLHEVKTRTNVTVHQKGDYLNPVIVQNMSGLYGADRVNKFYTGAFLDKNPETFQRIG